MTTHQQREPLRINDVEALPSGPYSYLVRHLGTGQDLGAIRECDDRRFEASMPTGRFAGVHKTLAEAIDALSLAANMLRGPLRGIAAEHRESSPPGRNRPVRRGVYGGLLARRNIAP